MRQHESILSATALLISIAWAGCAATISKTGTLTGPEDSVLIGFTLVGSGTVTLQAHGFGRGENAAGTAIPSVGFDPFVGLCSATGPGAVFIDGTSDILSNYSPGCPPARTLAIGSVPNQCGDVHLEFTDLAAGPSGAAAGPYEAYREFWIVPAGAGILFPCGNAIDQALNRTSDRTPMLDVDGYLTAQCWRPRSPETN